jgi:hypothetical protein
MKFIKLLLNDTKVVYINAFQIIEVDVKNNRISCAHGWKYLGITNMDEVSVQLLLPS